MRIITTTLKFALIALAAFSVMLAGAQTKSKAKVHTNHNFSAATANKVVLKRFPGKIMGKTKLENEEGKWQYGVLVMSKKVLREVMVDAKTGKIASVEVTDAKKERLEAIEDAKKAKSGGKAKAKRDKDDDGEKED